MFQSKKIILSLTAIGLASASIMANAQSLTIDNRSNHDSVARINKGACSSLMPGGITRAHTVNNVPESLIKRLCGNKTCVAEIYMEDACNKGPVIANVEFNINTGLGNISAPINGYRFRKLNNFSIIIEGGPA